jgi:translation initiation factor 2B subunit (eIF-2B alpha/beta/delta family)
LLQVLLWTVLLSEKINAIESDRTSGASQIARNALAVLEYFVQTTKTKSSKEFTDGFNKVGKLLFLARPNMAVVQNLVAQAVYEVNHYPDSHLSAVRDFALNRVNELTKQSITAVQDSAKHAAKLIGDNSCVASCSSSSTIVETMKQAKQQRKYFKVYIAESKTVNSRYGEDLANSLKQLGIDAEVFSDNQIHEYVKKTQLAIVGADSLLFGGSIINGAPSGKLAVAAAQYGLPFYCVCETAKANVNSYLGKAVEPKTGFDVVPAELVTGIVTENGVLDKNGVVEVMRQRSKFFEGFVSF